jgi:hypothetical protein
LQLTLPLPNIWAMIRTMSARKFFLIWTLIGGALGIVVPLILMFVFFVLHRQIEEAASLLWPSSIMFMALDVPAPAPWSTVIAVCSIAIIENALLYAVVGAAIWPLAYATQRLRHRRRLT